MDNGMSSIHTRSTSLEIVRSYSREIVVRRNLRAGLVSNIVCESLGQRLGLRSLAPQMRKEPIPCDLLTIPNDIRTALLHYDVISEDSWGMDENFDLGIGCPRDPVKTP